MMNLMNLITHLATAATETMDDGCDEDGDKRDLTKLTVRDDDSGKPDDSNKPDRVLG